MPGADSVTTPSARSSDDGLDPSGRRRYGDIALNVPLRASTLGVEVRVWQDVGDDRSIYIGARVSTESWDSLGMIPLPLDDGLSPWGRYRYGDISLDAPLTRQRVVSLAGLAGVNGYRDGPGDGARFGQRSGRSMGLAVDHDGSVLVADFHNVAIRRISPDGRVRTVAGRGEGNRDGSRDAAQFSWPRGIAVGADGVIYVADTGNGLIRRVASDGAVTTVGSREEPFIEPTELAVDPEGNLLLSQLSRGSILRLSLDGEASVAVDAGNVFMRGLAVDDEGPSSTRHQEVRLRPYGRSMQTARSPRCSRTVPGSMEASSRVP